MSAKAPPVPEENRSPKGPGDASRPDVADHEAAGGAGNTAKQGDSGNIHVNTTHQGHQQDR